MSERLSQPEERKQKSECENERKQAPGSKTAHRQQGGPLFRPSQPIVLFAEGESANPPRRAELGGFTLSILISGNSLILGVGGVCGGRR